MTTQISPITIGRIIRINKPPEGGFVLAWEFNPQEKIEFIQEAAHCLPTALCIPASIYVSIAGDSTTTFPGVL